MRFRRLGSSRAIALGAWIKMPAIESTEVIDAAGFDFAVVDMEHTLLDTTVVERHLVVGRALGMTMLVRVPDATPSRIQRLLDGGADGVFVPHVDDADAAESAVASADFPPHGTRGSGGTSRAGGFGDRSRDAYLASGGGVVAQIESAAAVEELDRISAIRNLGGLMLGPADLGLDPRRGDLGAAVDISRRVVAAAHEHGISAGTACGVAGVGAAREAGFDFAVCANDVSLLAGAAAEVIRTTDSGEEYAHD